MKIILDTEINNHYVLSDANDKVIAIITSNVYENIHNKLQLAIKEDVVADSVDIIKIETKDNCNYIILVHLDTDGVCDLQEFYLNKSVVYSTPKPNLINRIKKLIGA